MTSRPLVALLAAACALVAAVGAFAASGSGSETVLLVPADVAMAKKIALQKADIGPGWTRDKSSSSSSETSGSIGGNSASDSGCQLGVDLSKFTISGGAGADYGQKGAFVSSSVMVFPDAMQAAGDLAANMGAAGRKCFAKEIAGVYDQEAQKSSVRFVVSSTKTFRSSSFKTLHAAHVYAFALNGRIVGPGGSVPLSSVVLSFVKDRVVVVLFGMSTSSRPMVLSALARRMLGRFPGAWTIQT